MRNYLRKFNSINNVKSDIIHKFFKIDNVFYTWFGGFGAVMFSKERGLKHGDKRIILGYEFKVFGIERGLFKDKILWSPANSVEYNWIESFKKDVFK